MRHPKSRDDAPTALTRRDLLGATAAGAVALAAAPLLQQADAAPADPAAAPEYLTPPERFGSFVREKPPIDQFAAEKLREVGLDRDTWQLEVVPDPESNSKVERPLSKALGTALDWSGLMKLAEKRAVRFLRVLTCTNANDPFGMGLWEGVPLREVIWLARPTANVRRVYYHGYHNDDPAQRFQSSLPMGRVLEDDPWGLPVILCYKLNGEWLSAKQGGPVRMIVPEAYGNKSVKWLQRVALTNSYQANDTYALWNNDVESPMKTFARFLQHPTQVRAGETLRLVGMAQVGVSGLSKVQVALTPEGTPLDPDDPHLERLEWRDARVLPPPREWGAGIGKLPPVPLQFDPLSGKPRTWPLRYTIAQWSAALRGLRPGRYHLRCRAVDANGVAQPLPRPLPKSGNNALQQVSLVVEAESYG